MLLWNGRVTGISGILGGVVERFSAKSLTGDGSWRVFFLLGMISGGMILKIFYPQAFQGDLPTENRTLIAAGFLVGFGTLLGSGCTSGHGVCGISRLSVRSLCATILFILSGMPHFGGHFQMLRIAVMAQMERMNFSSLL